MAKKTKEISEPVVLAMVRRDAPLLKDAMTEVVQGVVSGDFLDWYKAHMPESRDGHDLSARAIAWCAWCGCADKITKDLLAGR